MRVNLLGPGPRLMKKEFTGTRSHKGWETLLYTVYFICKLFYIFRVVSPPIIRSTNNCIYSIWYWSTVAATRRCCGGVETVPNAVNIVIFSPDDGWRIQPKHVEQFTDKINCV